MEHVGDRAKHAGRIFDGVAGLRTQLVKKFFWAVARSRRHVEKPRRGRSDACPRTVHVFVARRGEPSKSATGT